MKMPIIVIAGPTASGKTELAIELANTVGGEIVCADSMQIYKYMDIGTAKPTREERKKCPHYLVDFVDPRMEFSVADYVAVAHTRIADIVSRGKIPVMCGGTGLYINSVVDDVEFGEYENDYALRNELNAIAERDGAEKLIDMLREVDPVSAERLHPNNLKRVIRAIEFFRISGVPISEHQEETKKRESRYEPVMFLIDRPREELYERINRRVDIMLNMGLVDEVRSLLDRGITREMNSMQGIGYKEIISYLEGEITLDEAKAAIKQNSRRYAKRQLTWFRRDGRIIRLEPDTALRVAAQTIKENPHFTL